MILFDELQKTLKNNPEANCYWVAYSGGCDSHVLLDVLYRLSLKDNLNINIGAVHVHHGLQESASQWRNHCEQVCITLSIPFKCLTVNATANSGQSPEAAARDARYQAISVFLPENDIILVAHHQDDQAETVLLQLCRGAGPRGLSAMPKSKLLGDQQLLRPFLFISQEKIVEYAQQQQLNWIDDPSNNDTRYDRNRIRHDILPLMKQRWPSLPKTLARVSLIQAEAVTCLQELAQIDWQNTQEAQNSTGLSIPRLLTLSEARQKNLMRYWIERFNGFDAINSVHLARIFNEVIPAANDSQPRVTWQHTQVCRYRGVLYVLATDNNNPVQASQNWFMANDIELNNQRLVSRETVGLGIKQSLINDGEVIIRFRQGGERCRPSGRANHHSLKKLFQEWAVPPWLRSQIPLIYIGNDIAQVVGYCLCEPYAADPTDLAVTIECVKLKKSRLESK